MNHDALKRAFENAWRLLLVLEPWRTIERNFFGFERNILLYNLFDRRNRNSSVKTRSNLSRNLFSNRSMTKEAWPTFLEEFLGTMRTKGTVRQVGWQMKFELLTSRFFLPFSVTRSDISYLDGRYIVVVSTPFSPTVVPGDREVSAFNYCASKSTKTYN